MTSATFADSQRPRPTRVAYALLAFAAAWLVSAGALFVNQVLFHGAGTGPGPSLGLISLVLQVTTMLFVARGVAGARVLVVLFLLLAALPLPMISRLMAARSFAPAVALALGFVLKALATWLLFSGDAPAWFAHPERRVPNV